MKSWMLGCLLVLVAIPSIVDARSPMGTQEYAAEAVALSKMASSYPAYRPFDAQMRSNFLSISVPTRNRIGKQVNFKFDVRKVTRRDRTWYYEVGQPQIVQ